VRDPPKSRILRSTGVRKRAIAAAPVQHERLSFDREPSRRTRSRKRGAVRKGAAARRDSRISRTRAVRLLRKPAMRDVRRRRRGHLDRGPTLRDWERMAHHLISLREFLPPGLYRSVLEWHGVADEMDIRSYQAGCRIWEDLERAYEQLDNEW
jgi:hypothetical protein